MEVYITGRIKKEKLYATGDISKFELGDDKNVDRDRVLHDKPYAFEHMCKTDTSNLNKIYNQLGYANKMNMRELKKMIKEYCVRYVDKYIKGFCPNDSNEIRCCLDIYCAYGGKRGKCTWNCKGTAHPGLCPGGNGFVCCI